MSGTSVDGIDAALLECGESGMQLVATREHPLSDSLRRRIADISHSGDAEIERLGPLDREIGAAFAQAALALLREAGRSRSEVTAIGSHGQTVRHRPPSSGGDPATRFTLQIGDPNTIAELTGITTVADFRRRDIAAGGEGAPLAPAFHAAAFSSPQRCRAVINIGGIANLSLLRGEQLVAGFDTGPGNTLLDHWIQRHREQPCDLGGNWAAAGSVDPVLLGTLLQHPYLQGEAGPRSTGKEAFNLQWLDAQLEQAGRIEPVDVMATLAEFTAASIASWIGPEVEQVFVCGGGAHNADLMRRLQQRVGSRPLASTAELGIHPDWVEAAAFAWLAHRTLAGLPGNAPAVTGAAGPRVLGAVYPG